MDCTGYTDYMDFLVIWNTCNLRIISIFWIIWIIRIVQIIRVIGIIWIIWIICNIRSIRIIWIVWTIWIVDCTDSSYFVSWKRSPRKRPRPGTRKGINRAAAWRACERPHGPCLWVLWCGTFLRSSELWLSNTAIGRAGDPRRSPVVLATERFGRPPGASWSHLKAILSRLKAQQTPISPNTDSPATWPPARAQGLPLSL